LESDTLPPSYIFLLAELEVDTNGDWFPLLILLLRSDSDETLAVLLLPGLRGLDVIDDRFTLFVLEMRPDNDGGNDLVTCNFRVPVSINSMHN
jgi:hypothetical protein